MGGAQGNRPSSARISKGSTRGSVGGEETEGVFPGATSFCANSLLFDLAGVLSIVTTFGDAPRKIARRQSSKTPDPAIKDGMTHFGRCFFDFPFGFPAVFPVPFFSCNAGFFAELPVRVSPPAFDLVSFAAGADGGGFFPTAACLAGLL